MYISRRKPTMRDRRMVVTSKTVAENAVCSREGCRRRRKRRENEMGTAFWVSGEACIYGRFYMETLTFQPRLACHSRSPCRALLDRGGEDTCAVEQRSTRGPRIDRKSTRLNSNHGSISYAVFCLKKKRRR